LLDILAVWVWKAGVEDLGIGVMKEDLFAAVGKVLGALLNRRDDRRGD